MIYTVFYNDAPIKESKSSHLFATQLARECYIDKGYEPSNLVIKDELGKVHPNHLNDLQ